MNILDTQRNMGIWVMPPSHDINENKGVIPYYSNANMRLRFASTSEFSFQVSKKYYDERIEQWVDNKLYDKLEKDAVLYTDWDNQVNSLARSRVYSSTTSPDKEHYNQEYKTIGKATGYFNNGFCLRDDEIVEYQNSQYYQASFENDILHYICPTTSCATINGSNGQFIRGRNDMVDFIGGESYNAYFPRMCADETYYKVHNGDIIYLNTYIGDLEYTYFKVFFYTDTSTSSCLTNYTIRNTTPNLAWFDFIKTGTTGYLHEIKELPEEGGYVRFCIYIAKESFNSQNPVTDISQGLVYSGQKYLKDFKTEVSSNRNITSQQYWVVKDTVVNNQSDNPTKSITAMSYDYVLKNRYVTMTSEVLNLYVPPRVKEIVEKAYRASGIEISSTTLTKQTLANGIINLILDVLPNWSVGHISQSLISKYRTFTETESQNIYSLLTTTIPNLWNCFVFIDTANLTLNFYDKDDALTENNVIMSFHNAVKSTEISSEDTDITTALHIHTNDDTYYINLVNPTGDDIIYDFSHYKQELGNFVGSSGIDLWTRVCNWQQTILDYMPAYKKEARALIEANKDVINYQSQLDIAKSNYIAKIKVANISVTNKSGTNSAAHIFSETEVPTLEELSKWMLSNLFNSDSTAEEIRGLVVKYWDIASKYSEAKRKLTVALNEMKITNQYCNINGYTTSQDSHGDIIRTPHFTSDERAYLSNFIKEGHWTDENAIFSENYSAFDIYDTLTSTYNKAKSDMEDFIAQPTYDIKTNVAAIMQMPEYKGILKTLFLGSYGYVEVERGIWTHPILLEINIDFDNRENSEFVFTTDYRRKPLEVRFRDLFDQINKVSVTNNSYTYEE